MHHIRDERMHIRSRQHQAQYTQMLSRLHSSHDAAAARRQTVASLLASYSTCFSRLELLADPLGEFWSLRNDPSNCWLTIHVQRLVHALSASASYGTARQACLPCHVYSHTAIVGACVRAATALGQSGAHAQLRWSLVVVTAGRSRVASAC